MVAGDARHADNGVHRGADIVRHVGEEAAFRQIGALRRPAGLLLGSQDLLGGVGIEQNENAHGQHPDTE